jgi:hypothetical protein
MSLKHERMMLGCLIVVPWARENQCRGVLARPASVARICGEVGQGHLGAGVCLCLSYAACMEHLCRRSMAAGLELEGGDVYDG